MRDITNEVKDFKKFYIIPKNEVAMEIHSANADDAMSCFAFAMDSDMNTYFRAVTEEEYHRIKSKRDSEGAYNQFIDWACDVLRNDFDEYDFSEEMIGDLAEAAWDINCEGKGYTEYECIQEAVEEYKRTHRVKVYDISWETDGEEVDLPTEVILEMPIPGDEIADTLSDEYGFLIKYFSSEVIEYEED